MSQTISKFGHDGVSSRLLANSPKRQHGGARANSGGVRPGAGRPYKMPEAVAVVNTARWHVYQTHPQAERLAAEDLTRIGYHGYAPMIAVRRQDPVIRSLFHKVRVARFPGYGFVELGPGDPWQPILEASGVSRILRAPGGRPARVPVGEIESHMLDDDRLCDLARETLPPFAAGDRVILLEGTFASHEGQVLECDGLVTTVEVVMFARPMPYRLDRASVEAV